MNLQSLKQHYTWRHKELKFPIAKYEGPGLLELSTEISNADIQPTVFPQNGKPTRRGSSFRKLKSAKSHIDLNFKQIDFENKFLQLYWWPPPPFETANTCHMSRFLWHNNKWLLWVVTPTVTIKLTDPSFNTLFIKTTTICETLRPFANDNKVYAYKN